MNAASSVGKLTRGRTRRAMLLIALGTMAASTVIHAQTTSQAYPNRLIRIVVGFPPGGSSDAAARVLGAALSAKLGQPVIVDNRAGANTAIATQYVKGQPADGYTLLAAQSSFVVNPSIQQVNYNVKSDFTPVALLGVIPLVMVTPNQVAAKSVSDLLAKAKAEPGKIFYASYGIGGAGHIASELMLSMAGVDMVHVPYKGSGPALVDVMGNQVSMMMATVTASLPLVKEGKVRALGVTSSKRVSVLPNVPALAESGLPGFELVEWESIQAPAGTPKEVVDKLNTAIREISASPEYREKMMGLGVEVDGTKSPVEVGLFLQKEGDKLTKIVRERNIKLQ